MSVRVCAVIRGTGALEGQTREPDDLVAQAGSWHEALREASGRDAAWYWLLDEDVSPAPDALAQLLAPLADLGELPKPALMASKVQTPDRRLHPASAPWPPLLDREVVIAAAQRRLVSLRLARWGSLLVHRTALAEHDLPRADFAGGADDLEWTARILRMGHGYLAPHSVVTRRAAETGRSAEEIRDRLRMVRGERWVAQEPVWFGFMLGVDALRDLRAAPRPRTVATLARGLSSGAAALVARRASRGAR